MAVDVLDGSDPHFAVHGSIEPYYDGFVDTHVHLNGDVADSPEDILIAAAMSGLTGLVVTDHDSTSGLARYQEINEVLGLDLDLYPGVESTVLTRDRKGRSSRNKSGHVLVIFDPEMLEQGTVPKVPCYMTAKELNIFVHENGGRTSVAHPAMGGKMGGFSIGFHQIREVQADSDPKAHFDYVEGLNTGVVNLIRFKKQNPVLATTLHTVALLPHVIDTNRITRAFVEHRNASLALKGMTAGTDTHSVEHLGASGIRFSRAKGLIPSLDSGDYALVQSQQLAPPWNMRGVIKGTLGGWRMEIDRRRGSNGFVIYNSKLATNN